MRICSRRGRIMPSIGPVSDLRSYTAMLDKDYDEVVL